MRARQLLEAETGQWPEPDFSAVERLAHECFMKWAKTVFDEPGREVGCGFFMDAAGKVVCGPMAVSDSAVEIEFEDTLPGHLLIGQIHTHPGQSAEPSDFDVTECQKCANTNGTPFVLFVIGLDDNGERATMTSEYFEPEAGPKTEGENPKRLLRSATKGLIQPGDNYWLNLARPDEDWDMAEFCPVEIHDNNTGDIMDGMYGLADMIHTAIAPLGLGQEAMEEMSHEKYSDYIGKMFAAIKQGVAAGNVEGYIGPLKWRLLFNPEGRIRWNVSKLVQVHPGARYDQQAEAVAENPKAVLARGKQRTIAPGLYLVGIVALGGDWKDADYTTVSIYEGNRVEEEDVYAFMNDLLAYFYQGHDWINGEDPVREAKLDAVTVAARDSIRNAVRRGVPHGLLELPTGNLQWRLFSSPADARAGWDVNKLVPVDVNDPKTQDGYIGSD